MENKLDYKIVYQTSIPEKSLKNSKYLPLLKSLPMNKAIVFTFKDKKGSLSKMQSLYSSLKHHNVNFIIRTRSITKDGKVDLYVWKELKSPKTE